MGPARSVRGLHRSYVNGDQKLAPSRSLGTILNWSARYGWLARGVEYDAAVERFKDERRREELESGLALDFERVHHLKELANFLLGQVYEQGAGGNYHNVWLPDVKQIGSGKYAERVDIERFNAAIISELRSTLDDLAKETGGRIRRQEITGLFKNIDMADLSLEQLERLAAGEDPLGVLTSTAQGQGGDSTAREGE